MTRYRGAAAVLLPLLLLLGSQPPGLASDDFVDLKTVKAWSDKLGSDLAAFSKYVTNFDQFQQNYKEVEIKIIDGKMLVDTISKQIEALMSSKIESVKRIVEVAEQKAMDASTSDLPVDPSYEYRDAKNYSTVPTSYNAHFGGDVNLNFSAVHVPTTVYGRAKDTLHAIRWSEELDRTFKNNYQKDPSLSWQYFGSSTGFMRQFPAIHWKLNGSDPHDPDLFDCRTRSWYIEAATSPKDVLILVDTSGSMTGQRKEIARHVVNNILDTLGNNDFVNIIKFSNITEQVVPCFGDGLVQANLANIRELKNGIAEMNTERIANFTMILSYAFQILEDARENRRGACCNQAIMLVTDGVPEKENDIFERFNWITGLDNPDLVLEVPVRIFTYVIGREVADVKESREMACSNRGYFVHLSTLAEVREQVLNYISVMARPLVLNGTVHPTIWTPVYADIADPKITDWLWDKKERNDQKERYWIYRRNKRLKHLRSEIEEYVKRSRKYSNSPNDIHKYRLMTSVSQPVYDKRENANITEQVLVKNAYWVEQTRESRIANLLGVAGIDVPIDDIKQLMMPHMLGVHGYAFVVTNNGYVLIHPDLRPVFQGILKPAYNSVDMAELELVDGDDISREFSEIFLKFREDVVRQKAHSDVHLITKYHYDDMKRAGKLKRKYDSAPIRNTSFTLVVSLPIFSKTDTTYRVHAPKDVRRLNLDAGIDAAKFFEGKNWRIHPEWLYCKSLNDERAHKFMKRKTKHSINKHHHKLTPSPIYPYHFENTYTFESAEEELKHFLSKTTQPLWNWGTIPSSSYEQSRTGKKSDESTERRYCDRDLILNLVFDAEKTKFFTDPLTSRDEKGPLDRLLELFPRAEFRRRFGYTLAFVATRSGLTRWKDFLVDQSEAPTEFPNDHFSKLHPRTIDEVWYKRAVEQYYVNPESFVFSIPVDEDGATDSTLVTATRAIFVGNETMKAPAAVAGFQMTHTAFQNIFHNITQSCIGNGGSTAGCKKHCGDDDIDCFLVDNHGYIVAAKEASKAGQFLGNVHGIVMENLEKRGVFEKITVFDYQAVCFRNTQETSNGNILMTPFKTLAMVGSWAYAHLSLTLAKAGFWGFEYAEAVSFSGEDEMELEKVTEAQDPNEDDEDVNDANLLKPAAENKDEAIYDQMIRAKRTRPEPCDQKVELYVLRNTSVDPEFDDPKKEVLGCDHLKYTFWPVINTNMILLAIDRRNCHTVEDKWSVEPQEIIYSQNASSLACQKNLNNLYRRLLPECFRTHPREIEIKDLCGRAPTNSHPGLFLVISLLLFLFLINH